MNSLVDRSTLHVDLDLVKMLRKVAGERQAIGDVPEPVDVTESLLSRRTRRG